MNEEKFTGKADVYEKFRPGYPDALIDYLYDKAKCDKVADIGAGTGKFTRCLLRKPWSVTAVEPNDDMRGFLSRLGRVSVVNAAAENTGLPFHAFGLVTAAQAFHWFDADNFKIECRRILTDNGCLAVIWNSFIEEGLAARQREICRKYSTDEKFARTGHVGKHEDSEEYFRCEYFSRCEKTEFFGERMFDRDSFIGETLSRSHAPQKDNADFDPFLNELNSAFDEFSSGGKAAVKCRTVCFLGNFGR